ncbi:MAG TPA: exodeoxyribonuclease VII large subunit, partial [Candidatus Dormibacteraeota bacterium]
AAQRALLRRRGDLDARRGEAVLQRLTAERMAGALRELDNRAGRLEALAPEAVLARGYSITEDEATGQVLRAAEDTEAGRRLRVRLAAGSLAARVEEVRR